MIVVVCLLTWSGWAISPKQAWVQAGSIAQCQKIAQTKKFGLVSVWYVYDLDKPKDQTDFAVRCGKGGVDCEKE